MSSFSFLKTSGKDMQHCRREKDNGKPTVCQSHARLQARHGSEVAMGLLCSVMKVPHACKYEQRFKMHLWSPGVCFCPQFATLLATELQLVLRQQHLKGCSVLPQGFFSAPGRPAAGRLMQGLYTKPKNGIEIICTDAAANELLASDMLRSKDGLWKENELTAALPNLADGGHALRDAAHAKRRAISR